MYDNEETTLDLSTTELQTVYEGIITNNAAAPTDDVFVRIPQFDGDDNDQKGVHRHGPCRWSPRPLPAGGIDYPNAGDKALVVIGDLGNYWILGWWPYS